MATCKYCGKPAGLLRSAHKQCETRFNDGRNSIYKETFTAIQNDVDLDLLRSRIATISSQSHIGSSELQKQLIVAWEQAVERFLDDGILSQSEETRLVKYKNYFLLNDNDLDKHGALTRLAKAGTVRDILEGKLPKRVLVARGAAINLQKNEQIIWVFSETEYLEDKTRRQYVGRSSGISVRIMKGLYYRTGAFKGHPVEYTERVSHGKGLFVVTNKHVYFHGPLKSFRVRLQSIVSFEPYSDGIGITKDTAGAKTQIFVCGDGWFIYNILSNINNLE
jgi:hypothetical protein